MIYEHHWGFHGGPFHGGHFHGPFWMGRGHRAERGRGRAPWAEWFGEPAPRAERGEVRYLVLHALADRPRHGYEVIQFIEERSRGGYRPSPGVIYPTLQMLEEMDHARGSEREGRKVYEITEAGRVELTAHQEQVDDFYARAEDVPWEAQAEEVAEVMRRVARLMKTLRRAARRGLLGPRAMRQVWAALDEAFDKIDRIFDEER